MATRGGINTVLVDGEYRHITDLNKMELSNAWTKRQRELNDLYAINAKIATPRLFCLHLR